MIVLVTGGVRSGKSHHAEQMVVGFDHVHYVATGPDEQTEPDPDWAERLRLHRQRRPRHWRLHETTDISAVLAGTDEAVLIDCLGTWLTRLMDAGHWWDRSGREAAQAIDASVDEVLVQLRARRVRTSQPTVLVTNEVGLGVIPSHRSGALFRDLLGTLNRRVGQECEEVHLVVAGRVLRL